ncbi:hypothetical protein [Arthrobacter sp. 2MCAF14]|uniref:hypothetical protein n=1 Tax=Arthrobacter sp. 2MCAF14 TaxID=3232982 RepID=UPI003F907184
MPKPGAAHHGLSQTAFRSRVPDQNIGAEDAPVPIQDFGIDEYSASPWIGLHYRHEFMLHYRHELLEHQDLA